MSLDSMNILATKTFVTFPAHMENSVIFFISRKCTTTRLNLNSRFNPCCAYKLISGFHDIVVIFKMLRLLKY